MSRLHRHARLRKKVSGTAERPRLVINRSSRHIHVQLVNDLDGSIRGGTEPPADIVQRQEQIDNTINAARDSLRGR